MIRRRYYNRLFMQFVKNTFARETDYRSNLIAEVIDGLLNIFVNILFFKILFLNTSSIAGWTGDEMLVLVAITQAIMSVLYMFFMNNLPRIQRYALRGDFDYILLKPCDSQFYISFRYFYFGAIPSVIFSIALLIYAVLQLDIMVTIGNLLLFLTDFIAAIVICYSIWFLIMILSIVFIRIGAVHELFLSSLKFLEYPRNIYKGIVRILMVYIIPLATVSNIPAESVLGRAEIKDTALITVIALIFFALTRFCYMCTLKRYYSASS